MKKATIVLVLALGLLSQAAFASRPTAILGPGMGGANFRVPYHERTNRILSRDTTYILTGWYFIDSTFSIMIPAGTLIRGDSASGGSLIISRGAQIHAIGTKECPIVMTSNKPAGTRTPGDWGGPIILGSAPCDFGNATTVQIEGGFGSFPNTDALYGGNNYDDNSGEFEYVRIEFAGIAFAQDNEINGLTLGGVGRGTKLDHIQVSFSNDDDVEMFGGTVDLKYYVGWRMLDDDIDTDQGYSGRIQFAYEKRDPAIFDASAPGSSEGYESDGESPQFTTTGSGPFNHQIHTQYHASNVTIVGPQSDTGVSVNAKFTVLARLRRACRIGIYNNVMVAYPQGIDVRDSATQRYASEDSLEIRNTSIQSKIKQIFEDASPATGNISGFNVVNWFNGDSGYTNWHNYGGRAARQAVEVGFHPEVFNLDWSNNPIPIVGSEIDTAGTNFQFAAGDPFFDSVSYRGAFDPHLPRNQQWDWGWTNYDPQNYDPEATVSANVYNMADGWNMMSLQFSQVSNPAVSALFPTAVSRAFSYNGTYQPNTSISHGPGYWMKFSGAQTPEVVGCLNYYDTISINQGWNIVGSVADTVPVGNVTTSANLTSPFYGYNGSYIIATTIDPGKAYWVRSSNSGKLYLDGWNTPKPQNLPVQEIQQLSDKFSSITVSDTRGRSQTLRIGTAGEVGNSFGRYELPPLPPPDAFDVRFGSQRSLEVVPSLFESGKEYAYPISIQGAVFPLTLQWKAAAGSPRLLSVTTIGSESKTLGVIDGSGKMTVSDAGVTRLIVRLAEGTPTPREFALSAAYPNPFNPATHLNVDVPRASVVEVAVYDVLGRTIATLISGEQEAGRHVVEWDSKDYHGMSVPSGVYLVRMTAGTFSSVQKIQLMK